MTKTISQHRKLATTMVIIVLLMITFAPVSSGANESSKTLTSSGVISSTATANINIVLNSILTTNRMILGTHLDYDWDEWNSRQVLRELTANANLKIIRFFDRNPSACTAWNEATQTGTFNWNNVDTLIQTMINSGAEPLVCLGFCGEGFTTIPTGMQNDPATGLPQPETWAAYCKEWVKHFKNVGLPVRFYETMNEPWLYFGWNDYTKINNFMNLFNAAAASMRNENPNIMIGFDGSNRVPVLDYWLANGGANLDFISFHKYDAGTIGSYTDQQMFDRAETNYLVSTSGYYGIQDAKQTYYNARGKWIPVINSEGNFNSAYATGTDPKIQQMAGAVWSALGLRKSILEGLDYSLYYCVAGSASWEQANKASGGVGFGMINLDNNNPWYPYYVQKMIAANLAVGDQILESTSSSNDLRSLSWIHNGSLKLLLISRSSQTSRIVLQGISGTASISFIDSTIHWETPALQTGTINLSEEIQLNGYTVMLIEL